MEAVGDCFWRHVTSTWIAATNAVVYYMGEDDSLYAIPLPAGQPRRIGRIPQWGGVQPQVRGFSVSPDDQTSVWAVADPQQLDLYLVRN